MSKAFTREDANGDEERHVPVPLSLLPEGAKNLMTPDGVERLRQEVRLLLAARHSEGTESARRVSRIQRLRQALSTAFVVSPPSGEELKKVKFGATVRVRHEDGSEVSYRIVGVDEGDLDRDWISWISPMAQALLNKQVGEKAEFTVPPCLIQLEVLDIAYREVS